MTNYDGPFLDFEGLARELPIDLGTQIEKEIVAIELLIASLRSEAMSADIAGLLAEAVLLHNHLTLLKTHILTTYKRVLIDPADDDYLLLKAIGGRLDHAILTSGLMNTAPEHLHLLVSTIRKGLQIADNLTAS